MEGPLLAGGAHEVRERGEAEGETTLRDRFGSYGFEQVRSGGSDTAGTWAACLAGGPRGEAKEKGFGRGVVERPRLLDPPGVELVGPALLLGHAFGSSRLSCCSKER